MRTSCWIARASPCAQIVISANNADRLTRNSQSTTQQVPKSAISTSWSLSDLERTNMGSKSIRFIHLNCHNAMAVENQLAQDVLVEDVDVVSINQPYVCEGSVRRTLEEWTQVSSAVSRFQEALWVNKRITFSTILHRSDVVSIRCRWSGK